MSASGKAHEEEVEYVTMVRLSWGCGDGSLSLPHPLEGKLCAHVNTAGEGGGRADPAGLRSVSTPYLNPADFLM